MQCVEQKLIFILAQMDVTHQRDKVGRIKKRFTQDTYLRETARAIRGILLASLRHRLRPVPPLPLPRRLSTTSLRLSSLS